MKNKLLILFCFLVCINTTHAQTNWELLNPKPTANTGKDVDFVSNEIGYIITSNELLETLDAGINWTKKQDILSGNDMSFYNTTGYIVGSYGYVLKSVDSGASWSQIATGFDGTFNTVNVIDDNTVILSTSNSIVKTEDGGTTWQNFSIANNSVIKTFFTSALTGHAVCGNGTILKTIDGGQEWYVTESTTISPSNFLTVYFINESVGFASREHTDVFKTTDGGETWIEIIGPGEAIYDFHFLDQNNGFATGSHGATYKTTNGGTTWTHIFFQNAYVGGTNMYGIYFQDAAIGYATGNRGRIIKTTDGGTTWTAQSENYNDFRQLQFIDENIAYAQTGNDFYKTVNAGNSWDLVGAFTLGTYTSSSDFTFVNENLGYATTGGSYGGNVYKTTNGGVSWSVLNNGFNIIDEGIISIFFLDENTGFISGGYNQKKVMKTTNGGATWTQVFNQAFGQIQFITNQIGYAHRVGYSTAIMYKTVDGGNTWNVSIETDEQINAFDFVDENNGYFVGDEDLMYKTNDGGANWVELDVPYEWYTEVNFQTKNIGFIADEEGKLYKTENGGLDWQYLTEQSGIKSIALVNDKIYTAGTNGKIYRSDVTYETIVLHVNAAENITNSGASLSGNVTSNGESVTYITFEYSVSPFFINVISGNFSAVDGGESLNISIDLEDLLSNTTYYYRLRGTQNSTVYYSEIISFTTLADYEIVTNSYFNNSSTTAVISGSIVSNGNDITNVAFEYGLSPDSLNSTINGTPTLVPGGTTEDVTANLVNLQPDTQYFFRIKATHLGDEIYGDIQSFTTFSEYYITLYNPNINGSAVTLSANLTSYSQNITDIIFEYGTLNYENYIATNPSQVDANSYEYVSATLTNLNTNLNYHYRLKGMHNGEAIYSQERVFNLSGAIILVNGTIEETQPNTLQLKGLINSYGSFLTDIHFEYGLTESFGSSVSGTPNYVYGYNTNLITGLINNTLPNQTYYYRLVANNNGNTIYSNIYQYTTGTLGVPDLDLDKEIVLYPNPATDFLNFKFNTSEKVKCIEFYNALGQRIYYENFFNNTEVKVDVSNLTRGMYFIRVRFESAKVVASKIILK